MQSLGVKLRLERERQKLGIRKIAEDTCIAQRYLEAIEADDQSSLPGEFFYRAFVRQYSKYLGWDPDEVEKQINLVSVLPSMEPAIEIPISKPTSLNLGSERQVTALREVLKDKPIRPAQDVGTPKRWLAFAALVIVACAVYFGWRNFTPAPTEVVSTPAPPPRVEAPKPTEQASQPSGDTALPTPAAVETPPGPVAVKETSVAPVATASKPGLGQFSVTVRAKATTWIRITADGAKIFGGTIDEGQERTVTARDMELIVGNAGTLDVIYNGKQLAFGTKGEVKTLLINSEGWKLKPKPPAEPTGASSSNNIPVAAAPGPLQ